MTSAVSIRLAGADDLDMIMNLVAAVSWPHRREDVAHAMALGHAWIAIAEDAQIVGVAMWWEYARAAARIGLVIVSPDHQGQGIGRRLMDQVLVDVGSRRISLLATEEGRALYEKQGFRIVGRSQRHQGPYRHGPAADPRVRQATVDDYANLARLDAGAIAADREPILRHLFEVGRTFVLEESGQVIGYSVERAFGRGSVVGPIVAPSEAHSIALFKACAQPGFVRVDRPIDAERLGRYLTSCGLEGDEISIEMRLGDWPADAGNLRVFAMAGHAWG